MNGVRFAAALLVLAGCPHRDPWPLAGDGGPADAAVFPGAPDARPGDRPDGSVVSSDCDVRMNLGEIIPVDGIAQATGGGAAGDPETILFNGPLNNDPKRDFLQIELYKGFGVFASSIAPGSYEIAGAELNYATCGICVRILADFDTGTGETSQYLATGGRVELSSIAGQLTGTLSGVSFETVTINPTTFESTPVGDGCVTSLDRATFDEPISYSP